MPPPAWATRKPAHRAANLETICVPVGSGKIACYVGGHGETVVLLHPTVMDSRAWDLQRPAFERRYQVVAVDQRGHGGSDPADAPYDPAEDVAGALAALGVWRAAVIGLGDGADIALRLALLGSFAVEAVVLVMPMIGFLVSAMMEGWSGAERDEFEARLGDFAVDPEMAPLRNAAMLHDERALAEMIGNDPGQLSPGHPGRALLQAMARDNVGSLFSVELAQRPSDGLADRLSDVCAPCLLVWNSLPRSQNPASSLAQQLSNASEHEIPTCAAMVNIEEPELFNDLVLSFLNAHRA